MLLAKLQAYEFDSTFLKLEYKGLRKAALEAHGNKHYSVVSRGLRASINPHIFMWFLFLMEFIDFPSHGDETHCI